ncbi:MAG: Glutamate-tRNA ligase [Candidatus Magasanikbacteria bacterium GW2011_GWC2_37_14]|uniref:Glutamate--tRNA ligase n=1 Tax=Candidatus Magasanikbacteria bacterium GW2011_GWC2_37_14 TaxID=1619046 RepID=A0A0G0IVF8_9BACT|nr:MAG: Glutamate-tRNA ligase [Candidatus Magasanikbacteria bacterium GW2011_GWC2_37_14]
MIRTRFAPSPTGFLHIGNFKMALTDFILAKQNGGEFVLRIEDTDRERLVDGAMESLLRTLKWAGIEPDEGVKFDLNNKIVQIGGKGPYIQSERLSIYRQFVNELINNNHAYYCFCSKERLDEVRKIQELNKQASGYDGHCRNISLEEAKKMIEAGESAVVRMKMPKEGVTKFTDLIRGEVSFENKLVDDQVILKSDGFPTYHLAVVVDDHLMKITHIVRGEEWLSSTPKHIELYKMFGWQPPLFAHLPLLLNPDRSKLSKRQGDVAVEDYIKKGYLPEAVINFVAFLGWNPGDEREIFSLEELVKEFSLEKVNKAGAVFNLEKLDWYNREYLKKMSNEELVKRCGVLFEEKYHISDNKCQIALDKVVGLEKERATTLVELVENVKFVFELGEYEAELLVWKKSDKAKTKENLAKLSQILAKLSDFSKEKLELVIGEWLKAENIGTGDVLWPMRVALSGQKNSPGPYEIAEVLGKDESLRRINQAIAKL